MDTTHPLPRDTQTATLLPGSRWGYTGNVWVITFQGRNIEREIVRCTIVPPDGIATTAGLALWDEQERLANAPSALSTGFSLLHPILVPAGMTTFLVWGTGSGTQPKASLYTKGRLFS